MEVIHFILLNNECWIPGTILIYSFILLALMLLILNFFNYHFILLDVYISNNFFFYNIESIKHWKLQLCFLYSKSKMLFTSNILSGNIRNYFLGTSGNSFIPSFKVYSNYTWRCSNTCLLDGLINISRKRQLIVDTNLPLSYTKVVEFIGLRILPTKWLALFFF